MLRRLSTGKLRHQVKTYSRQIQLPRIQRATTFKRPATPWGRLQYRLGDGP
ncbi:unnamed protein product [Amoebophrya sp. A120]|nr:unnamed protein product [Amoebophrya sp. A120]|eukprot:GSA120T00001673001.1